MVSNLGEQSLRYALFEDPLVSASIPIERELQECRQAAALYTLQDLRGSNTFSTKVSKLEEPNQRVEA